MARERATKQRRISLFGQMKRLSILVHLRGGQTASCDSFSLRVKLDGSNG